MTLIAHHWLAVLIALLIVALAVRFLMWAFIPHRQLPGNRVRHNRIRIRLRLHPGRGHATVFELWLALGPPRGVPPQRQDPSRRCRSGRGS